MSLGTGAGQLSGDRGPPVRPRGLQPVAIVATRTSGPVQRKRARAPILNVVDPQTGRGAMW
jgi:hypothetical protein